MKTSEYQLESGTLSSVQPKAFFSQNFEEEEAVEEEDDEGWPGVERCFQQTETSSRNTETKNIPWRLVDLNKRVFREILVSSMGMYVIGPIILRILSLINQVHGNGIVGFSFRDSYGVFSPKKRWLAR